MAYETSAFGISVKDSSNEISTSRVNVGLITAANLAARITARDAYIDAVEAVINGTIQDSALSLDKKFSSSAPAHDLAAREVKLLIVMEDGTTMERSTYTIPCFDPTTITMISGTDRVDMSIAPAAALRTAIQNFALSPKGNSVVVRDMIRVGRNL